MRLQFCLKIYGLVLATATLSYISEASQVGVFSSLSSKKKKKFKKITLKKSDYFGDRRANIEGIKWNSAENKLGLKKIK